MSAAVLEAVLLYVVPVLLVPPVSGILTDPGPVCPGDTVTLNCTSSDPQARSLGWIYDGVNIITILPGVTSLPTNPVVSGVEFSVSLLPSTDLVSQISFMASSSINGRTLQCSGDGVDESVQLQVGNSIGK